MSVLDELCWQAYSETFRPHDLWEGPRGLLGQFEQLDDVLPRQFLGELLGILLEEMLQRFGEHLEGLLGEFGVPAGHVACLFGEFPAVHVVEPGVVAGGADAPQVVSGPGSDSGWVVAGLFGDEGHGAGGACFAVGDERVPRLVGFVGHPFPRLFGCVDPFFDGGDPRWNTHMAVAYMWLEVNQ